MNAEEIKQRLKFYLRDGIAVDIFLADQAYALAEEIGGHADQINIANFGELFGSLQLALSDRHTLAIAKIFDQENSYPTRSIPATLSLLENNAEQWEIPQKTRLHQLLISSGLSVSEAKHLSNVELTHAVVAYYRQTLPNPKQRKTDPLSLSLDVLRQSRDKVIAHNEAVEVSDFRELKWSDATSLLNYAKEFVVTVGFGYLNTVFGQSSEDYVLSRDAGHASRQLRRLMKRADISSEVRY